MDTRGLGRTVLGVLLALSTTGAWVDPSTGRASSGVSWVEPGVLTPAPPPPCRQRLVPPDGQQPEVIPHPDVTTVFWGSHVDPVVQSRIGGFFSTILNSPYMDWLSQYGVGRGSYSGSGTISPPQTSGVITDDQIQQELEAEIEAGQLPDPASDPSEVLMIYFPPGMTIEFERAYSCGDQLSIFGAFCGYHNSFTFTDKLGREVTVRYAVIPDFSDPGCGLHKCGDGPTTFDNVTSVSSHELVEMATDPSGQDGYRDRCTGAEIGDLCNHQHATVDGYTVQKQWDNQTGSCIATANDRLSWLPWRPVFPPGLIGVPIQGGEGPGGVIPVCQ